METTDAVFEHVRPGQGDVLIIADHASNHIPAHLGGLGLSPEVLDSHIAYDPGTADLGRALSAALGAEFIASALSRLVIDKNRRLDQAGLIPEQSDGIDIPSNQALGLEAINARKRYHETYHALISQQVASRKAPLLLSLHSFTPEMDGFARPWECGLLYNQDGRVARQAIAFFEGIGLCVGDNEPYSGKIYNATMDRHAEAHGHPYVMLEIRNDLLRDPASVAAWTKRISALLSQLSLPDA